jgi:hypothetical protein
MAVLPVNYAVADGTIVIQTGSGAVGAVDEAGDNARVPYAGTSACQIPGGVSDEAILLPAGILPTGYEVGVPPAARFVTRRFGTDDFEQACDVFGDAAANGALKVVITREEEEDERG